jgi:hypothetical protein
VTVVFPISKFWLLALPVMVIAALFVKVSLAKSRLRRRARDVIEHLQTQSAFQQLAMETYNDGIAGASDSSIMGDEIAVRGEALLSSPSSVRQFRVPAARRKLAILEHMTATHESFDRRGLPEQAATAMSAHSLFLDAADARARLQLRCLSDFATGREADASDQITSLDADAVRTMDADIAALNELIGELGMSHDEWLAVVRASINKVRELEEELPPLSHEEFMSLWMEGQSCGRPRFFGQRQGARWPDHRV